MQKQQPPTVEDVIDEYSLPVRGMATKMMPCPGHEDNTASLSLHVEDDWWYCFSCLKSGDGVGLVALLEGVEVVEILRRYGGQGKDWKRRQDFGLRPHELRANMMSNYRDLYWEFFEEVHKRLAEGPEWILLAVIDQWGESFDEVRDCLDDEDNSVYEREVAVKQLRARCERWLGATE